MTTDLDRIYTRDWYEHDFAALQPEFDVAAAALFQVFEPKWALDVGAGPGMLVRALRGLGVKAQGFDGSVHAIDYAHPEVKPYLDVADIRKTDLTISMGAYDLIVCTEVAEHLEAEHADTLVRLLTSARAAWIVFTAAPPGQDGHHHVNCQPMSYWAERFITHGYEEQPAVTRSLQQLWAPLQRLSHMTRNVCVFGRKGA